MECSSVVLYMIFPPRCTVQGLVRQSSGLDPVLGLVWIQMSAGPFADLGTQAAPKTNLEDLMASSIIISLTLGAGFIAR